MGQSKNQTHHGKLGGMLTLTYIELYVVLILLNSFQLYKTGQERKI